MESKRLGSDGSQLVIREAIRRIALGRSVERVDMSPGGTGGVGTARLIHGYVAKIHDDPSDAEFAEYGGTIDVGEYPDETPGTSHIVHKGVLLAGAKDNSGGFLVVPTLLSDVTVVSDAATRHMYVVNFSHADLIQLRSHTSVSVGVTETEQIDTRSDDSPDYDELEPTGNETRTTYTATAVDTVAGNKNGKAASIHIDPEGISQTVGDSRLDHSADKIEQKVGGMAVTVTARKTTIGADDATEPLVLGRQLATLMREFITECTKIVTPTLMGTMPAVNAPNFAPLLSKIDKFLSQKAFTK